MKKYIILCYSKTGNSRFIAEKLSRELSCDLELVSPNLNYTGLLFLISLLKIPIPTNISTNKIKEYEEIIVIGPIWGGLLIAPLRTLLKKCFNLSKPVHFAVTCETNEDEKDNEYGYNQVLKLTRELGGEFVKTTAAFSTSLIKGYEGKIKTDIMVKAKITEDNFSDELRERLHSFKNNILGK
jgi:flavodoxin